MTIYDGEEMRFDVQTDTKLLAKYGESISTILYASLNRALDGPDTSRQCGEMVIAAKESSLKIFLMKKGKTQESLKELVESKGLLLHNSTAQRPSRHTKEISLNAHYLFLDR